jgi:hypothetical protein
MNNGGPHVVIAVMRAMSMLVRMMVVVIMVVSVMMSAG